MTNYDYVYLPENDTFICFFKSVFRGRYRIVFLLAFLTRALLCYIYVFIFLYLSNEVKLLQVAKSLPLCRPPVLRRLHLSLLQPLPSLLKVTLTIVLFVFICHSGIIKIYQRCHLMMINIITIFRMSFVITNITSPENDMLSIISAVLYTFMFKFL